jgi:hypothetical protein
MKSSILAFFVMSASLAFVNPQSINWNGNNWALNCDFIGNDFAQVRVTSDKCGGACVENPTCTHFAYSNWNGGTCWLKRGELVKNNRHKCWPSST